MNKSAQYTQRGQGRSSLILAHPSFSDGSMVSELLDSVGYSSSIGKCWIMKRLFRREGKENFHVSSCLFFTVWQMW